MDWPRYALYVKHDGGIITNEQVYTHRGHNAPAPDVAAYMRMLARRKAKGVKRGK